MSSKDDLYVLMHIPKTAGTTLREHLEGSFDASERLFLDPTPLFEEFKKMYGDEALDFPRPFPKAWLEEYIKKIPTEQKDRVKFIYGHSAYWGIDDLFGRKAKYIVFLRDPVERVISHYRFVCQRPVSSQKMQYILKDNGKQCTLEEWIHTPTRGASNFMVWYLTQRQEGSMMHEHAQIPGQAELARAKAILDRHEFVGIVEPNSTDLEYIYDSLNVTESFPNANVSKEMDIKNIDEIRSQILLRNRLDDELFQYAKKLNESYKKSSSHYQAFLSQTQSAKKSGREVFAA